MEEQEQIERIIALKVATPVDKTEAFALYKKLVDKRFVGCHRCASSIRQAINGLKVYYKQNY